MRNRLVGVIAGVAVACAGGALIAGCQTGSHAAGGGGPVVPATIDNMAGDWTVEEIAGGSVRAMLGNDDLRSPDLTIEKDGSVYGFSGVNRLKTQIDLEQLYGHTLSFGATALTMMAGPPPAMRVERRFVEALERVNGVTLDTTDTMRFTDGDETLVVLKRTSP